ncbi:interleukin-2 receptor subunit beta-like [Sinocyclocheilus anshuiensis]|uniref:interleukin-2 receptor subunit beta-like n=1 Tax=Sinocyclocheilus anshuiensis TaxID=1608454 RepID=UPI0007BA3231|nr:PREDICTED: interleukin-2 receptor subunit beta-like [Sinocyclocheilus anshuiensis]XP_016320737.1 PREDICTED: interleukin-2 receptor subunit beta-like [Sinocyclocheilus anshuiensis]
MKNYWHIPLFIFIIFYGTGQSRNTQTAGLACVNDYVTNISCVWWNSTDFSGQRCELVGKSDTKRSCELVPLSSQTHPKRSCSLNFDKRNFFFLNKIWLNVICNGSVITKLHYQPGRHIKTQPPDKPTVSGDNITWSKGSNFPKAVDSYEFQLQFKATYTSWETAAHRNVSHGSYVLLDHNLLTVGEEYQARVRVKPVEPQNDGYFRGEWSDWSPAASWRSEIGKPPVKPGDDASPPVLDDMRIVLIIGFHILLVLAGLCLVIYKAKKSNRSLKPNNRHVPDPSKYFQPLHTVHGGNFRKWLGCQNSVGPFLTPQSCDDISPVEVSDFWDVSLIDPNAQMSAAAFVHSNQVDSGLDNSGTSHASSSGFSNTGYFYSKSNTGSLHLESCPVYFTYHPEEGTSSALSSPGSSYDCLQTPSYQTEQPISPDSGFDMPEEEHCEDEDISGAERCAAEGRVLVPFIMSLSQGSLDAVHPVESFTPVAVITPWFEPVRAPSCVSTAEPAEGTVIRPSSMIEPSSSGYLTLKEMQKYSNKSI